MSDKIISLIKELKDECLLEKCPMYVTVADEEDDGTHYETEALTPLYVGKHLTEDRISPLNALGSKKFRLEFIDEVPQEEIEAEIMEAYCHGSKKNAVANDD